MDRRRRSRPSLRSRIVWLTALVALLGAGPAVRAQTDGLVAERIDEGNAARLLRGGPDAIGGIGDWALGNATLCAVVSDPGHQSNLSLTGGALIDLGLCGREDDQFLLQLPLLNNSLASPVAAEAIQPAVETSTATLLVTGGQEGLVTETRYALDTGTPRRLRIETRLARESTGGRVYGLASALATVRSLSSFSLSTDAAAPGRGFVHPSYRGRGLGGLAEAASPVDLIVAVGAAPLEPGIAYGQRFVGAWLERGTGERVEVPHFFFVDGLATVLASFGRPFWLGDGRTLGRLQLFQTRFMDLAPGERLVLAQEIWVGDRADVASVTDLLFAESPWLRGTLDDPQAVVEIGRADGSPLTQTRVKSDGSFALRLPPGEYRLQARAPGGREFARAFRQGAAATNLGALVIGPRGRVRLPQGDPMRLVFVGEGGTPDPDFDDDLRGYAFSGGQEYWAMPSRNDLHLTGTAHDPEAVVLRQGRYRVYATRGPEFSLSETQIEVRAGETTELRLFAPVREVETPGWIGADLHVHAAASLDTPLDPATRVASFVAQGGEVLVSTDHDAIYDYAPLIEAMGLGERVVSLIGLEITSELPTPLAPHTIGHANAFPLPYRPAAYRRGAVADEGRRWREIIEDLRALPGVRVIQLNHARFEEPGVQPRALFSHLGPAAAAYDPARPLEASPNRTLIEPDPVTGRRDLDFDAIELLNGPHMESYRLLRRDWFSLLRQGERLTGTANSDSHFLRQVVACPRSYVQVPEDEVSAFDAAGFVRSVREGRVVGSTGPLVEARLDAVGIGERFAGGQGVLDVRVRSASWIPVSVLRVFVSGVQVHAQPVRRTDRVQVPLRFAQDAFVTVEVQGQPSAAYRAVLPGFEPLAFTNPIWVDADRDGRWTPPGLPPPP